MATEASNANEVYMDLRCELVKSSRLLTLQFLPDSLGELQACADGLQGRGRRGGRPGTPDHCILVLPRVMRHFARHTISAR